MSTDTSGVTTFYCSFCQEPTSFSDVRAVDLPPDRNFTWDCRPCGHRNHAVWLVEDGLPTTDIDGGRDEPQ